MLQPNPIFNSRFKTYRVCFMRFVRRAHAIYPAIYPANKSQPENKRHKESTALVLYWLTQRVTVFLEFVIGL